MRHQPSAFDLLLGTWRLAREMPPQASAHGQATVRQVSPTQARYDERVTLHLLSGQTLHASAAYVFHRLPNNEPLQLDVHFAHTGHLFHHLHFAIQPDGVLLGTATHHCAADTYHSTYRLHPCGRRVEIEHRAHGPAKDYIARTTLTCT